MYNPVDFNPLDPNNEFIKNYRESLQESYDAGVANLENQRKLDQSAIMNQANKAGVMFSNIPQRMKIQYDTNTYMPNFVNTRKSYQTGLDTLRQNGINTANQVAYYQQLIDHYNALPTNTSNNSTSSSVNQIAGAVKKALENQ